MSWKNVARNEHRVRKKSGRARKNAMNGMTPQGEAVWCNREVPNAYGYVQLNK